MKSVLLSLYLLLSVYLANAAPIEQAVEPKTTKAKGSKSSSSKGSSSKGSKSSNSLGRQGVSGSATQAMLEAPFTGFATQNGGTTGGRGGKTVTVKTLEELSSALKGDEPKIVIVSGVINTPGKTRVGSNKTVLGKDRNAALLTNGLFIRMSKNVIVRNLRIAKVQAKYGDAITIQGSRNVWIDHCDLSSDQDHGKDYYDGLLDVVHGSDFVTVTNTHFHDHFKASLVGHSDKNEAEDKGHLRITFANNWWTNIHSRAPSIRFGTAHIINTYFDNVTDGINTRDGAQVLVQGNVFRNSTKPLYSTDAGYAVEQNNVFGDAKNAALPGKLTSVPYKYNLLSPAEVKANEQKAGNMLHF